MIKNNDLGKPSGIGLREHTDNVKIQARHILYKMPFLVRKFKRLTGLNLEEELLNAVDITIGERRTHNGKSLAWLI